MWTQGQKLAFRVAFIFFISLSIPNSMEWYDTVIHIDWTRLNYRDLYDIARFGSGINIFGNSLFGSTMYGYANWVITLLIAVAGGVVWTVIARRRPERMEYNTLYYWLRVIVRYRAGIGIIGFGFTKLLPVQMPYPGYGLLNTNFGDMTAQKIFWLSVGIVPWYQVFAGVVEVLAGTLLFFRRTTSLGAILLVGALGDIVYVNFAYDGGVHVYSSYFVLLAGFLLVDDVPRIYRLLIQERVTVAARFYPIFRSRWLRFTRIGLKTLTLLLFLIVLFYLQLVNFLYDPYKQPSVAGVRTLRGIYTVTEFRRNSNPISYSPQDSLAWHEVEFEKWSSLSFVTNRPVPLDLSNGGGDPQRDVNRTFEITGVAGGRRVFHYYADTVDKVLYLEDKYKAEPDRRNRAAGVTERSEGYERSRAKRRERPRKSEERSFTEGLAREDAPTKFSGDWPAAALAHIGKEVDQIDARAASTRRDREYARAGDPGREKRNRMILHYDTIDGSRVILSGIDERSDSIYMVLDRVTRNFALTESGLQAGKY